MAEKIKVKNPTTGEIVEELDIHSDEEIRQKIDQVAEGFKSWKKVNAYERKGLLKEAIEIANNTPFGQLSIFLKIICLKYIDNFLNAL